MNIEERIENLERGLLRAKRTNVCLLIILCLATATMISGAAVQTTTGETEREINTRKITLIGEKGKVRATLSSVGDEPGLKFFDDAGVTRAQLVMKKGEPSLVLSDKNGIDRIVMNVEREITQFFIFNGINKSGISFFTDMQPSLGIFDMLGKQRVILGISSTESYLELDGKRVKR